MYYLILVFQKETFRRKKISLWHSKTSKKKNRVEVIITEKKYAFLR